MRRISDDCNARAGKTSKAGLWKVVEASALNCHLSRESRQVRLRGIGSSFLEGANATEAHDESVSLSAAGGKD